MIGGLESLPNTIFPLGRTGLFEGIDGEIVFSPGLLFLIDLSPFCEFELGDGSAATVAMFFAF